MGVVYLAEHPVIGKKVAMKAIHPELSQELRGRLALRDRGEGGQPDRPRAHRRHRRLRQHARRRVLLRDGVPAGRVAVGPPPAREPPRRRRRRCRSPRRSPTRWTPRTSRASSTAISSPRTSSSVNRGREPRLRQGARLRPREADAADQKVTPQDAHRLGDGHAVLHVPRAVRGEDRDRSPRRHLLAGRAAVRDADRQGAVRRRRLRRDHRQAHHHAAAVGPQHRRRAARRAGPDPVSARWPRTATSASRRWPSAKRRCSIPSATPRSAPGHRHPGRSVGRRARRLADGALRDGRAVAAIGSGRGWLDRPPARRRPVDVPRGARRADRST